MRRKPDVVFHLAAQATVRVSVDQPAFDAEVNILGTLNIVEGALAAGVKKVVFAGSGGTLYGVPEHIPVREGHPQAPLAPYGVSKKAVGDYLHYYREVRGLEYTVLALANVYGPRQDPHGEAGVIAIFAGLLLQQERPTIYGDGEQTRDFVYVDDVVDAFVRASEKGGGLIINIGTGVETSVQQLYDTMARIDRTTRTRRATSPSAPASCGVRRSTRAGRGSTSGGKPWTKLEDGLRTNARVVPARSRARALASSAAAGLPLRLWRLPVCAEVVEGDGRPGSRLVAG